MKKRFYEALQRMPVTAIILLAAVLTVFAIAVFLRLLRSTEEQAFPVVERQGVYDLTDPAVWNESVIRLVPGPSYYPEVFLSAEKVETAVPQSTLHLTENRVNYLSQRFVVDLPDNEGGYTLTFRFPGRHAMQVYVNGILIAQGGRLGVTKADTDVWEDNITCFAVPQDGRMEIILHAARFYHYRSGAQLAELTLQRNADTVAAPSLKPLIGFVVTGALLCAAALLLGIFLLLSRTRATMFFALACLSMALREWIQSQAWVYFPVSGNLISMLEYMSVVLLTLFLSLYLADYAVNAFLKATFVIAIAGSLLYGMVLLFTDSIFYTRMLVVYQLLLIAVILPGIGGLFITIRRPNREQAAVLYGIAVFFAAAVADILMSSHLLGDGNYITLSETAMLVFVLAQTVSLFLMNNRLLAETRATEQKLAAEKDALQNLNRMKTEFLGNVSHELKTPLTVMSGYAQTTKALAERPGELDGSEVARRMKLIASEAERLSLMVGQVLDTTRIEEGRMAIDKAYCRMEEIIHSAIETHYPMLNKNGNRLEIRLHPPLPMVFADPARIGQVIVNLIANAARFTSQGFITVSAEEESEGVLVCVADNGDGIAAEQLPHVFERYHTKNARTGKDTGTGLGLYICKYIVEQHGGSIWVESEEGRGTSVFFTLPAGGDTVD